ncbi:hypothetical protein BD779DRAFT_1786262, partial [Infundibulicybe gibba]
QAVIGPSHPKNNKHSLRIQANTNASSIRFRHYCDATYYDPQLQGSYPQQRGTGNLSSKPPGCDWPIISTEQTKEERARHNLSHHTAGLCDGARRRQHFGRVEGRPARWNAQDVEGGHCLVEIGRSGLTGEKVVSTSLRGVTRRYNRITFLAGSFPIDHQSISTRLHRPGHEAIAPGQLDCKFVAGR